MATIYEYNPLTAIIEVTYSSQSTDESNPILSRIQEITKNLSARFTPLELEAVSYEGFTVTRENSNELLIKIKNFPYIRQLFFLDKLSEIEAIAIKNCFCLEGLQEVSQMTNLRRFEIEGVFLLSDITPLLTLGSLEEIKLIGCNTHGEVEGRLRAWQNEFYGRRMEYVNCGQGQTLLDPDAIVLDEYLMQRGYEEIDDDDKIK